MYQPPEFQIMPNSLSPITLGTAALGMKYGIANTDGTPSFADVTKLLDVAWSIGVTAFDTAPAYGKAERRLGNWQKKREITPCLMTKLPSLKKTSNRDIEHTIRSALEGSLERLGATFIDIYLTHDAADYFNPAIKKSMAKLAHEGKIKAFGLSVYTADEVFSAIESDPPKVIQMPLNAIDSRMLDSGALDACRAANVVVLARSVFLQGLLLTPSAATNSELAGILDPLAHLQELCESKGTNTLSAAFRYVRDIPGIASTIVGVTSHAQLEEIVRASEEPPLEPHFRHLIWEIAQTCPPRLLDPRQWRS